MILYPEERNRSQELFWLVLKICVWFYRRLLDKSKKRTWFHINFSVFNIAPYYSDKLQLGFKL